MSSNEKKKKTKKKTTPTDIKLDLNVLYEIFSVIYTEGLWQLLSPPAQDVGRHVYKLVNNEELPETMGTMKFSAEQHMEFINHVIPTSAQQTDFWKLVTRITWFIMLIEKNPLIAQRLTESQDSKEEVLKDLSQGIL